MSSIDYLDLLMSNQKKVKDEFKFINLKTNEQATIEDCYENIKKDLEILKILKEHTAIQGCIYDKEGHECIEMIILEGDINYNFIKEWLENAK